MQAARTSCKSLPAFSTTRFPATLQSPGATPPRGLAEPSPLGSQVSQADLRESVFSSSGGQGLGLIFP